MDVDPLSFAHITSHIAGPLGGTIAISWAAGAASGYVFAMKTVKEKLIFMQAQLKLADQVCESRIKSLDERHSSEIETLREVLEAQSYQIKKLQEAVIDK